ncbi:MAG: efflux RND transporter periplasmic adaptor subunit [Steroidobacteraceae bacterium]|nr:efflux RND transporter periplasmic adaptor subunit [Steroidobacteraceae bacterium]
MRPAGLAAVLVLAAAGVLAACGEAPPAAAPASAGAALPTLEVRVGTGAERRYDGSIEAVRHATLTAQTAGRVAEVLHDVDDRVRADELLLRLAGVEQRAGLRQAQQALREAQARNTVAAAEYERIRDVYAKRLVARSALDRATAERDAAAAQLDAAEAGVAAARENAGYTALRAPYAAVVTRRHVEPGEAVAPGQPLMEVAALERLRVVVDVPSAVAGVLRAAGEQANAVVWVGERRHEAGAITVFPAATAQSSTVRVRVDLPPGAAGAYPGLYAKVAFAGAAPATDAMPGAAAVPTIPTSAVAVRSEVTAVYVVGADGRLQFRQVRLGRRYGDEVEVLAGLAAGERIAANPIEAARRRAGVAP